MAKIKFHLDENITLAIANGLRRRGIDITTTAEQGMIGQSDVFTKATVNNVKYVRFIPSSKLYQ